MRKLKMEALRTYQRLNSIDDANIIIPQIWVGNYESSKNVNFLRQNQITVIINCSKNIPFVNHSYLKGVYKYRVPVHDNLKIEEIMLMEKYLYKIVPIIHQHYKKKRNILIHCAAGMQRSAIVALAYLYTFGKNRGARGARGSRGSSRGEQANQIIKLMKSKRPIVFTPFMNFKMSFRNYAQAMGI